MRIAGQTLPHESARGHVTGEALYTDDLVAPIPGILHAWPVMAPHAHALVVRLDAAGAIEEPGVVATLTAADVPGEGDSGANRHDEPLVPERGHVPLAAGRLGAWRNARSRTPRRRPRPSRVPPARRRS